MSPHLTSKDTMMLKFMERAIDNINTCLAGQYTLYKVLIEKGLVTEAELISRIREDKNLPQRKLGIEALKEMLTPEWEKQLDFDMSEQELFKRALDKINNLILPAYWEEEGVEPPNLTAQKNTNRICYQLFDSNKLIPRTVACTKENGVYLNFVNGDKSLIIEAYNTGEIGVVVNDNALKKILYNEEIKNLDFDASVKIFLDKQA
jgi:hypothetical protein